MQGMTMAQFQARYPEECARFASGDADYVIPGGESRRQRHECSVAAAKEIAGRHAGQRIVVVTHGGVLQSLFRHVVGLDVAAPRRFSLYNASINTFTVTDGEWGLGRWGDTHHLKGLGTMDDW
jgi:probable phosphoglycerate mutase